jgi:hypothetical protein
MTRQSFPSIACPCGCPSTFPKHVWTVEAVKAQRAAFTAQTEAGRVRALALALGRPVPA